MSAPETVTCKRCGTAIPGASTGKLCPACLMSGAIAAPEDETLSFAPGQSPAPRGPGDFPRPPVRPEYEHSVWIGIGQFQPAGQSGEGKTVDGDRSHDHQEGHRN